MYGAVAGSSIAKAPGSTVIRLLTDKNPKREGSKSWHRFGHYRDGMRLDEARQAGITVEDLRWDLQRQYIDIDPELIQRRPRVQLYGSDLGLDMRNLSAGEELWLWRNRQKSPTERRRSRIGTGLSQIEAAERLRVTHQYYNKAERDRMAVRDIMALLPEKVWPETCELIALARRRSRRPLREIIPDMGITRISYLQQERSADPRIVAYWRDQGYIF